MSEVIVRMTSDHIKVKGAEYVMDLVRCAECGRTVKRSTQYEDKKYCPVLAGWVDDDFYCGYGEVRDE